MKASHLKGRDCNLCSTRTWSRYPIRDYGMDFVEYVLSDSTRGRTAAVAAVFTEDAPRELIAGELRAVREDLREMVAIGPPA